MTTVQFGDSANSGGAVLRIGWPLPVDLRMLQTQGARQKLFAYLRAAGQHPGAEQRRGGNVSVKPALLFQQERARRPKGISEMQWDRYQKRLRGEYVTPLGYTVEV